MVEQTLSVFYQNEEAAVLSYDNDKLCGYLEYSPSFINKNGTDQTGSQLNRVPINPNKDGMVRHLDGGRPYGELSKIVTLISVI